MLQPNRKCAEFSFYMTLFPLTDEVCSLKAEINGVGRKSAAKKSPAKMDEKLNYILSIIYSPLQGKSVLRIKLALMWKMLRVLGRYLLKLMCWISDLVSELIPMTVCAYLKTVENVRNSLAWLPQTSLLKMAKPMKPTPEPLSVLLPWIETPFVSTFFFHCLCLVTWAWLDHMLGTDFPVCTTPCQTAVILLLSTVPAFLVSFISWILLAYY